MPNLGTHTPPQPPATSGSPSPEDGPQSLPHLSRHHQPRGGRDRALTSQQNDIGVPTDLSEYRLTLPQQIINDCTHYITPSASVASTTSSTISDTESDGIDPITFARQRIGLNPMWEEMVERWDHAMGVVAWVRNVRDACDRQGGVIAV